MRVLTGMLFCLFLLTCLSGCGDPPKPTFSAVGTKSMTDMRKLKPGDEGSGRAPVAEDSFPK